MSIIDLFDKIKDENYVVIRNYESLILNDNCEGEDIDILCEDNRSIIKKLGLVNRHKKDTGVHYVYKTNNTYVKIDLWNEFSGYYDCHWCQNVLNNRILKHGIYVPDDKNDFYMLLYHVLFHKKELPEKYRKVIIEKGRSIGINIRKYDRSELLGYISSFVSSNEYKLTYNEYPLAYLNFDGVERELIDDDNRRKFRAKRAWMINRFKELLLSIIRR